LCLVFAGLLMLPLLALPFEADNPGLFAGVGQAFVFSAGIAGGLGLLLMAVFRKNVDEFDFEEGFAVVTFSWLLFMLLGALPYWLSGAIPAVLDACFESLSGLSTTGASILSDPAALGGPLLLWRALTHWVGGMGVVVLSIAVLPALGAGGNFLFQAETSGPGNEKLMPRIRDVAKLLWAVYAGLTLASFLAYWAAGMGAFDALCHAFATVATGGFGTRADSMASFGPVVQWVAVVFMLLAGLNYILLYRAMLGRPADLLRSTEARVFLLILVVASALCFSVLYQDSDGSLAVEPALRGAVFSVVSICSTTGFSSVDFGVWPASLQVVILALMLSGACAGSTSGAAKVSRHLIWGKAAWREVRRLLRPTGVFTVRIEGRQIAEPVVNRSVAYFVFYVGAACFGTLLLALLGVGGLESVSSIITCLSGVGPGLGSLGPTHNYADVPATGKTLLMGAMLLGRLEFFAVFALLSPLAWRR
jgi:trk system potassium uptake protein TrkH